MAETAGLVIGAVSLAGLFTNCVDSFKYLRLGQAFAEDFPVYQTELEVLELRFSRWAQAVTELSNAKNPAFTDKEAPLVKKNLEQIAKLFRRAKEDAEDDLPADTQSIDPTKVSKLAKIHPKLRSLIKSRQDKTRDPKVSEQFQWAIYKKDEFLGLIANVRQKVDDLETLVSVDDLRAKLATMQLEDAKAIKGESNEDVRLIAESGKDVDPIFGMVVEQTSSRNTYEYIKITDQARVHMAESFVKDYAGPLSKSLNRYHKIDISGNPKVSMGTMYGATLFDGD